ncbi:hypothetical protein GS4_40_00140 [Gordonia soli NBRC 108243]|uniref:Uncharacterized protein n=1 Tax=Gordonia soli NBRC 108243 TaxID=1223545 RepID=M0QS32_9ACTN|nr:hypothetical protein GS4_40_00140 [Gordonia soli NBRC 108243]
MPYAYVCTECDHLASRHYLDSNRPDPAVFDGPYLCSHRDCACTVSRTTPMRPISESQFNASFADSLDEYEDPAPAPDTEDNR